MLDGVCVLDGVIDDVPLEVRDGVPVPVGVFVPVGVGDGVKHWPSGKIQRVPTTEPP